MRAASGEPATSAGRVTSRGLLGLVLRDLRRTRRRGIVLLVAVLDEPEFRIEHHRRRLVVDEILELPPEVLKREPRSGGELRELVRIVEVVATQANHVTPRDRVTRGTDIDHADARASRIRVEQL